MTTYGKLLVKILVICLALLAIDAGTVLAQEPEGTEVEENVISVESSGRLNLTLQQLGYTTTELNQDNFESNFVVNLPGNFQIQPSGNYFDLIADYNVQTPDQIASLTAILNRSPIETLSLSANNTVATNTLRLDFSEALLKPGGNSLAFNLDAGGSCGQERSPVSLFIDETSILSFNYQQNPYPTDLALYPFPFTERTILDIPVTIVLPDDPTSEDLSVAATIAGGLGRSNININTLSTRRAGEIGEETLANNHLIMVGQPSKNSLIAELDLPLPINTDSLEAGQGALEEIVSPWNEYRLVLLVSGLDDEGISKASQALNRQAHFLGLQGPAAIVIDLLPLAKSEASQDSSFTLAALGYNDDIVYGATPRELEYNFYLPLGWRLEDSPLFTLKFSHADILDAKQSIIDVRLNGLPVGSTLLDNGNVNEGQLTVSLPGRQLKEGRNQLQVRVEMNLPNGDKCRDANDRRAWTVLSSESEIYLPYSAIDLQPDFQLLPYPFSQNFGMDQSIIVISDQPATSDLDDMIRLAAWLGSASDIEYISAQVGYASDIDDTARENHHLIVLGRPTENLLLEEINEYLPQPFEAGTNTLTPLAIDSVAFSTMVERDAGLLQLFPSPWSQSHSILAVTGTTETGLSLAYGILLNRVSRLRGNLAVIEPAVDPYSEDESNVSTYSIDTRPRSTASAGDDDEASAPPLSDTDLSLIVNRWWK